MSWLIIKGNYHDTKKIKSSILIAAVTTVLLAPSATVLAADFPNAPIQVAVAYGPGGATDFQARIATMMAGNEKYLNMPMVIFNKPGAGGQKAGTGMPVVPVKMGTSLQRITCHTLLRNHLSLTPPTILTI